MASQMITDRNRILLVVIGPTAVGKTSLTLQLAQSLKTEIICADSRQFYREMQIGTARPGEAELRLVPHHFCGHISILDDYNASRFESDAVNLLEDLFVEHQLVIMTGGSGLYINAVCNGIDELPDMDSTLREELKTMLAQQGIESLRAKLRLLDPVYYSNVDITNPNRLLRAIEVCLLTGKPYSEFRKNKPKQRNFKIIYLGLIREKEELNLRINNRVDRMLDEGLMEEVERLYPFRHLNALNTVGYKELFPYFDDAVSKDDAIENIKTHSRRYAKRQMTWFRKNDSIRWFNPEDFSGISSFVKEMSS